MLGSAPEVQACLAVQSLDPSVPRSVEAASRAQVIALDVGWRPNPDATRPAWAKLGSWAKLGTVVPKVVAAARSFEPDVIYSSQQRWDCTLASAVALALGKPQVVHLHYAPGPWLGRLAQQRLRECALVVAVSEFTRSLVIEHGARPEQVKAVLNSITFLPAEPGARERVRAELGFTPEHRVLGQIARFDETKGQRETIEAFARLLPDAPHARLVLVGDGDQREPLEALAVSLGVRDRVVFTGVRKDVSSCLAALDVFSHPSFPDHCPLAVLEAQAAGLPVAAFNGGGLTEIVAHGETGLLSPLHDVQELSDSFKRLLLDVDLSRRFGAAGAERVRTHFNEPLAGQRFAEALRGLLAQPQPTSDVTV